MFILANGEPVFIGNIKINGTLNVLGDHSKHGGMFIYDNSSPTSIDTNGIYKAIIGYTVGSNLSGWSFSAGISGAITEFADYGATVVGAVKATKSTHNLNTGDIITHLGTTNYNGTYSVTKIDTNNYYFTHTWLGNDASGIFYRGDCLKALSGSAGTYFLGWTVTADSASNNEDYKIEVNQNTSALDNIAAQTVFGLNTDYRVESAMGRVFISDGDKIWLSVKQISAGTDNLTIKHSNVTLFKI